MTFKRTIFFSAVLWLVLITFLHMVLNLHVQFFGHAKAEASAQEKFRVGFIPVTCHLTCPVTDFINRNMTGESPFEPVRFNGFPELKEAFLSGYLPATFILAPLAMALREQGVPIKIVYLGHRDGTALMVNTNSKIYRIEDLKGKTIAVPNRFSNQRLLIFKALHEHGMKPSDVNLIEMQPPDMPVALLSKSVDGITSGEPFMGQTELDGYGRVLYLTKDVWPEFISCVLAVNENAIKTRRADVQRLVDGIARSGKWLDTSMTNRMEASQFVAKNYYNQDPRLLAFVLSKPPDRVKYTHLKPLKKDFDEIEALAVEAGIMQGTVKFEDYVDDSFAPDESTLQPYPWEGRTNLTTASKN